jgi:hypothetical protein
MNLPTGADKLNRVDTDFRGGSFAPRPGIPAPQPNFGSVTTLQMR